MAVLSGVGIAVALLVLITIAKQFLIIGKPNEVLIFSGRNRTLTDGSQVGYREVLGGGSTTYVGAGCAHQDGEERQESP